MVILKGFLAIWLAIVVLCLPDCDTPRSAVLHILTAAVCLIGLVGV